MSSSANPFWKLAAGAAPAIIALSGCHEGRSTEPLATAAPTGTVAVAASRPAAGGATARGGHTITITAEQGRAAGLPAIGLSVSGIWSGFAVNRRPAGSTYLSLAGPPGGLLMFVVKPYHAAEPSVSFMEQLFEQWSRTMPGLLPVDKGAVEKIFIAGGERDAVGYLGGGGPGRASWCVTLVPAAADKDEGLMILMGVAVAAAAKPSCRHALDHRRLKPLIGSFRLAP